MQQATYDSLRAEAEALEAIPAQAWLKKGDNVALGIRRDWRGAKKPGWWPGRDQSGGKKAKEIKA